MEQVTTVRLGRYGILEIVVRLVLKRRCTYSKKFVLQERPVVRGPKCLMYWCPVNPKAADRDVEIYIRACDYLQEV
jgi:hypothetical protein